MSYNGYENFETHTTVLWLDTVLIDNQIIECELTDLWGRYPKDPDSVVSGLAAFIKNKMEDKADYIRRAWDTKDNNGDPDDAMQQIIIDFINSSIERVNFREVAQAFIEGDL